MQLLRFDGLGQSRGTCSLFSHSFYRMSRCCPMALGDGRFRMSHDCAVVSYGVVFSFIIAFRFLFEDVNLVFHCLAGMVCRNKCRVYLSNNQIWVCLFAIFVVELLN